MIPGLDLGIFGCTGQLSYFVFTHEADLARRLEEPATHCSASDLPSLKAKFLASLAPAHIRWQEESLVILEDSYGTGMAKAHLELALAPPDGLDASIIWKVPPPPVTPDTAVFSCAFAVKKSAVKKIHIHGNGGSMTLSTIHP